MRWGATLWDFTHKHTQKHSNSCETHYFYDPKEIFAEEKDQGSWNLWIITFSKSEKLFLQAHWIFFFNSYKVFIYIPVIHPWFLYSNDTSYRYCVANEISIDETPKGNCISAEQHQQSRKANINLSVGSLLLFYSIGFLDNLLIPAKMSDWEAAYFLFLRSYFIW